jgi:hypothetical protein
MQATSHPSACGSLLKELFGGNTLKRMNEHLTVALIFGSLSMTALAEDKVLQPINAVISDPAKFEVNFNRANPTGTGAVIAGVIGAAVQRGAQSSEDSDMADKVLSVNPGMVCDKPLLEALNATLQSSGAYEVKDRADKGVEKVEVDMSDCGLQLADSATKQLLAYVNLTFKVHPASGGSWKEDVQVSGRSLHSFEEFSKQEGLATTALTDVLQRAGVRIAEKIIYKH